MMRYTYTIFDADPNTSSGTTWPSHSDVEIEADSDEEARKQAFAAMEMQASGLSADDGYSVGQKLYALVRSADGTIVGAPTYEITAADLGRGEAG